MNSIFNNQDILKRVKGVIQVGASIGEEIPNWEE